MSEGGQMTGHVLPVGVARRRCAVINDDRPSCGVAAASRFQRRTFRNSYQ